MSKYRVVIDVETSGLRPSVDRVLSLAAIVVGPDGTVVEEFSALFNPGVDPGPVHVHGLTPARLAGHARFADRAEEVARILGGHTVVAHNALFDISFLTAEFERAGVEWPCTDYLCTLDLAGRLHLSTMDLKLGTLAGHFGVAQSAAHDAYDDAVVLAGVLGRMLATAEQKSVEPTARLFADLVPDPHTGMLRSRRWAEAVAVSREWRPAPRYRGGGPLVQGMEIVFTQDVDVDPDEVAGKLVAAGLYVADRISGRTSLAVCDSPGAVRGRAAFARKKGLELVTTARLLELLEMVSPGRPLAPAGRQVDEGQESLF